MSNRYNHHLAGRAKQQTRPAAAVFGCPGEFGARSRWVCKLARSPARSTPRGGAKHEEPGGLGETQSKTGSNHRSAEQPPHNSATQSLGTCKCTISGFSSVWIRPFIGGGHTVWPVLPRSPIFKKTNLQKQDRGFQGKPCYAQQTKKTRAGARAVGFTCAGCAVIQTRKEEERNATRNTREGQFARAPETPQTPPARAVRRFALPTPETAALAFEGSCS